MNIIIFYHRELKYQLYREDIVMKLKEYDLSNNYIYMCINDIAEFALPVELEELNYVIFYPRQAKLIDTEKKIYNDIINIPKKKIIFIDDVHSKYHVSIDINYLNKFDIKLMFYKYLQKKFLPELESSKIISNRHYIHDNFVHSVNNPRNIKISILGHFRHQTYKTRKYIMNNSNLINDKLINCNISVFRKSVNVNKYYNILHNSYASIATTGDNLEFYCPYLVAKYFEIPGCGALLLAHVLPELEEEMKDCGFIENVNYIKFTNIEDLIEKCNYVFKPENKEEIERIRLNGYNLIINNHLISHRQKQIINLLNDNI